MAPIVSFSGIASGIDSKSLIAALIEQQRAVRVQPLQVRISSLEDSNTAFDKLKTLLGTLKDAAQKFRSINGGPLTKSGTSSDETILVGSATSAAANGTYTASISQLAKNATYSFKSTSAYSSADSIINSSINNGDAAANRTVTVQLGTGTNQETTSIVLTNTTTLSEFVNSFNSSSTKGVASVVNVGTSASPDNRVLITSDSTGTELGQVNVSVGSSITGSGSGAFNSNTTSQATDATFTLTGISGAITRGSNSIADVLPGVTLNLKSTGSATLVVGDDAAGSSSIAQQFVDAYNDVVNYIKENDLVSQSTDSTTGEPINVFGALSESSVDDNILSSLQSALSGASITGRSVNSLADLGITTERDGTLKFDTNIFSTAISTDSGGVSLVLQGLGDTLGAVDGTIAQYTQYQGLLDKSIDGNASLITDLTDSISQAETNISAYEASLTQRYAHLEAIIGQLNSQQSQLTASLPR